MSQYTGNNSTDTGLQTVIIPSSKAGCSNMIG